MASEAVRQVLSQSNSSSNSAFDAPPFVERTLLASPLQHWGRKAPLSKRIGGNGPRGRRVAPLADHLKSPRPVPSTLFTTVRGDHLWPLQSIADTQIADNEKFRRVVQHAKTKPLANHYGHARQGIEAVYFTQEQPSEGHVLSPRQMVSNLSLEMKTPSPKKRRNRDEEEEEKEAPGTLPRTAEAPESPRSPAPRLHAMPPTVRRPINHMGAAYVRDRAARNPGRMRTAFSMGTFRQGVLPSPVASPRRVVEPSET